MIIYWTSIDHSEHATLAASHLLDAVLNGLLCMGHVLACRKWLQLHNLAGFRGDLADDMYVCLFFIGHPCPSYISY